MTVKRRRRIITLFGNFGGGNFGNEATLLAMIEGLHRFAPEADLRCICTVPEKVVANYKIPAISSRADVLKPWVGHARLIRVVRRVLLGIPSELYRWLRAFKTLWDTDALVVPGTGLLTDAYTFLFWGPYDMFRWLLTAKCCGCRLLFVSVGAGPIYSRSGRCFIKAALRLANFRSYRDLSTRHYLKSIGFPADGDPVCPDLAFGLSVPVIQTKPSGKGRRLVVGLGVMEYAGRYSVEKPTSAVPSSYVTNLAAFGRWLLEHGYDIRLLIGDFADRGETRDFKSLLLSDSASYGEERVIDEPVESVAELLSQLEATELVVATRFHNILMSLLLNKPTLAISFHHKCSSLMDQMGLADYCLDINHLRADDLISRFRLLEANTEQLRTVIAEKVRECRDELDEQYAVILRNMWTEEECMMPTSAVRTQSTPGGDVRS